MHWSICFRLQCDELLARNFIEFYLNVQAYNAYDPLYTICSTSVYFLKLDLGTKSAKFTSSFEKKGSS